MDNLIQTLLEWLGLFAPLHRFGNKVTRIRLNLCCRWFQATCDISHEHNGPQPGGGFRLGSSEASQHPS